MYTIFVSILCQCLLTFTHHKHKKNLFSSNSFVRHAERKINGRWSDEKGFSMSSPSWRVVRFSSRRTCGYAPAWMKVKVAHVQGQMETFVYVNCTPNVVHPRLAHAVPKTARNVALAICVCIDAGDARRPRINPTLCHWKSDAPPAHRGFNVICERQPMGSRTTQ